jgi:hypothetical protein
MRRLTHVLLFVVALLAGAAGSALAPATATADTNPINSFSARLRAGGGPPAVGSPVTIDMSAVFRGDDDQDDAWMVFIVNFGGSVVASPRQDGEVGQTFEASATHTFDEPGTYAVKCGAYHGSDFFGYKFSRTKTIYVTVACAGFDPGPKKCEKAAFSPFTGTWAWNAEAEPTDFRGTITLVQTPGTKSASGTVTIRNEDSDVLFEHPVSGPVEPTRAQSSIGTVDALRFKAKIRTPEGKKTLTFVLITHAQASDAYFASNILIEDTPYFPGGPVNINSLTRDAHRTTSICTTLAAGKKKVKAGSLLAVTCALQSEGPVCLPAGAISSVIDVEGGTIVEQSVAAVRCGGNVPSDTELHLSFHALGAGKSSATGRGGVAFAVLVDDDATEVRITFSVARSTTPAAADVTTPPDRVICVAVEQPTSTAK